jgi:RNA polymerase sigma-70 factor (ECF subfamily)
MARRSAVHPDVASIGPSATGAETVAVVTADGHLITRLRSGDERAFDTIVRQHADALSAYAEVLTGSPETAAEVVQDVLYAVWRLRATLTVSGTLRQYLYGATRNRSWNAMRRARGDARLSRAVAHERMIAEGLHAGASADETVRAAELDNAVRWAIDQLPAASRAAYALRWEGLSHAEIAERLGVAVRTVEMRIGRALKRLRKQLAGIV